MYIHMDQLMFDRHDNERYRIILEEIEEKERKNELYESLELPDEVEE